MIGSQRRRRARQLELAARQRSAQAQRLALAGRAQPRRLVIAATLIGLGVLAARALGARLRARCMAGAERMFEEMPETFPPKRILAGIEEIRANTARTLELLEQREEAPDTGGRPRRWRARSARGQQAAPPAAPSPGLPPPEATGEG